MIDWAGRIDPKVVLIRQPVCGKPGRSSSSDNSSAGKNSPAGTWSLVLCGNSSAGKNLSAGMWSLVLYRQLICRKNSSTGTRSLFIAGNSSAGKKLNVQALGRASSADNPFAGTWSLFVAGICG
jgi:hypothetical protein